MVAPLIVVVICHYITDKDIVMTMILIAGNFCRIPLFIALIGKINCDIYRVLASLRATPVTAGRATGAVPLANRTGWIFITRSRGFN